ncbi:Transcriptional regulator [Terramyces sp. JEL0728]|nr:Transcriptional regulator [Terramyces sp. JEL0728]
MSKPLLKPPALNTEPIPLVQTEHRYKQYINADEILTQSPGQPIPQRDQPIPPIPSSHELSLIHQELKRLLDATSNRQLNYSKNQEVITNWIHKHDPNGTVNMENIDSKQQKFKLKIKKDSFRADTDEPDSNEKDGLLASIDDGGNRVSISNNGNIKFTAPSEKGGKNLQGFKPVNKLITKKDNKIKKRSMSERDQLSIRSTPDPEAPGEGDYSKAKGDEITPFMLPPTGKNYTLQWQDEDERLLALFEEGVPNPSLASNREYVEMEDTVYEGDIHVGTLSEKLMCSLVREGIVPDKMDDDEEMNAIVKSVPRPRTKTDLFLFEERLRAELKHIGLIQDEEIHKDDNEITALLQRTQTHLKEQISVNSSRKKRLLEIAKQYMGYQEYNTFLDDINKNVEQAYIRRFKSNPKKGKKKTIKEMGPLSETVIQMLENRKRMIHQVGKKYFSPEKFDLPTSSIFYSYEDYDQEMDE